MNKFWKSFYELPLLGTVKGGGFDCRDGTVDAYEGHKEGVWNRVRGGVEYGILNNESH